MLPCVKEVGKMPALQIYKNGMHSCYRRLGILSFMSMVFVVAFSCADKTPAVAAMLTKRNLVTSPRMNPWEKSKIEMTDWQSEPVNPPLELTSAKGTTPRNSLLTKAPRLVVQMPTPDLPVSPDVLPPANLPINQGGVVKVPPVRRPEAILPSTGTPPATVPPTNFPTNQTPTLRVPTLESTSGQTLLNTSKPLEGSFRRISPAINPVPVIEFGQPLPK